MSKNLFRIKVNYFACIKIGIKFKEKEESIISKKLKRKKKNKKRKFKMILKMDF